MNTDTNKTENERWVDNAIKRRRRIIESGGRQLIALVDAEHNDLLKQIIDHRKKNDPSFSITKWVSAMIVADSKKISRRGRESRRTGKRADRST